MFLAALLGLLLGFCLGTLTEQRLTRRPARLSSHIVAPSTHTAPPAHDPDSPPDTLRSAPDNEPPTVATGLRS